MLTRRRAFLYYAQEVNFFSHFGNKKATICNKREQFPVRVMRARGIFSDNCEPESPWGVVRKLLQIVRGHRLQPAIRGG